MIQLVFRAGFDIHRLWNKENVLGKFNGAVVSNVSLSSKNLYQCVAIGIDKVS